MRSKGLKGFVTESDFMDQNRAFIIIEILKGNVFISDFITLKAEKIVDYFKKHGKDVCLRCYEEFHIIGGYIAPESFQNDWPSPEFGKHYVAVYLVCHDCALNHQPEISSNLCRLVDNTMLDQSSPHDIVNFSEHTSLTDVN